MKKIIISLFIILLFSIVLPVCNTIYAADGTYDVILFWGQSNMTGYAGKYEWEVLGFGGY